MNKTESVSEVEAGSYLEAFLYNVLKKNHDSVAQNLMKFVPWFRNNGVRIEYYQLGSSETQGVIESSKENGMKGVENIAKTLSIAENEDIWMELQYFRDHKHCKDVYAKMMQDKVLNQSGTSSLA
jgi:hypothetical protein